MNEIDFAHGLFSIVNEDDGQTYLVRPCPYRHEERYSWETSELLPDRPPELAARNPVWSLFYYYIECPECHAKSPEYTLPEGGYEKAVEQWNSIPRPFDNDADLIVAVDVSLLKDQIGELSWAISEIVDDQASVESLGGLETLLAKIHGLLEEHDEVILQNGMLGY